MARIRKFTEGIAFRIPEQTRKAIEKLAEKEQLGIGEAARSLLNEGLKSRGLAVTC
jgi:hypothetical protein